MRVLHLISGLEPGGAETMLLKLVSAMDRSEFDNRVVSMTTEGAIGERLRANGIPVHSLHMRRGRPDPLGMIRLWRLLQRDKPAILQTWLYHADIAGLVAGWAARTPAILWNIRCSQMDQRYVTGLNGMVVRLLARLSPLPRAVIVNSRAGIEVHQRYGYHPRAWTLIPNGFDLAAFRPDPVARAAVRQQLGIEQSAVVIGLIARFDPIKDHTTFLRAAARVAAARPQPVFVLAGSGVTESNPALQGLVRELRIPERVRLLGERRDIGALTAALDIACCTSTSEGFPNVVGEAMACAVPVVMTDVGDARELLGDTGIVVPIADPGALTDALIQLIDSPLERTDLGLRAQRRVAQQFDIKDVVTRYQDLYRSVALLGNQRE